jgi:uncharacterized protein (UPF0332 family)
MSNLIALEIERGDEALKSAETLLAAGLYRDAMSRTYYAVMHYARAVLVTKNCSPKSHQGVLQLFSQHFIKTGEIAVDTGRILARQQKFREESDYTVESRFSAEAIEIEIADSRLFREECVLLITAEP